MNDGQLSEEQKKRLCALMALLEFLGYPENVKRDMETIAVQAELGLGKT
jgi:hypothetical protein